MMNETEAIPGGAPLKSGARSALAVVCLYGAMALGFAAVGCTVETSSVETRDQDLRVSLFHTTDWHSRILPYTVVDVGRNDQNLGLLPQNNPFGGGARLGTLLKCARVKDLANVPPECCCLEPSACPGFKVAQEHVCCTRRPTLQPDGSYVDECRPGPNSCAAKNNGDGDCASDPGQSFAGIVGSERLAYLDSGDYFQGAPIFNAFAGEVETRLMSLMKPDAVVIGNHEFDKGIENLADQYLRWGTYPLLAANYLWDGSKIRGAKVLKERSQPYTVINLDGVKIGVIGMANFSSMLGIFRGENDSGITPLNPFQVLQDYIDFLRPQVDLVVALSHMGLRGDENFNPEDEELVANTSGLSLILGGHLHIVLKPPKVVYDCVTPRCRSFGKVAPRPVYIEHSGAFLKYATRLDLVVRNQEIVSFSQHVYPIDRRIPENSLVNELLEPYVLELSRRFDLTRVHAYAFDTLQRFDVTGGDSDLGNLTCTSMQKRRRVETDFCMTNSLGIRDIVSGGALTDEQLFNVLPFENFISTLFLSGKEVQELFDYVTFRSADRGCATQAQISGATFIMNCAKIRAERVTIGGSRAGCFADADCASPNPTTGAIGGEICSNALKRCATECERAGGSGCALYCCPDRTSATCNSCFRPVNPDASYSLATNDYIAKGGSGFLVLERNTTQVNTGISLRQSVIDFLAQQQPCERAATAGFPGIPCINGLNPETPWASHDGRITRVTSE